MNTTQQPSEKPRLEPEQWLERHGDYLFRYALSRIHQREAAENLVQEALVAGFRARASFAGASSERTWLVGILKNKIVDHFRRHYRDRSLVEELTRRAPDPRFSRMGRWLKRPETWADEPSGPAQRNEFWDAFRTCLSLMPRAMAQAFSLHEIDRMDGRSICDLMSITPSNLWVMLYRARMRLRDCLTARWFNPSSSTPPPEQGGAA